MEHQCENCDFHGFPCLNCADYEFHGTMGPGYLEGKLTLCEGTDEDVMDNMIQWLHDNEICTLNVAWWEPFGIRQCE